MSDRWEIKETAAGISHVVPVGEEHEPDCWREGDVVIFACKCSPYEQDGIVVHRAFDKRELDEEFLRSMQ